MLPHKNKKLAIYCLVIYCCVMYIRTKYVAQTKNTVVQLVESYRENNKTKQRVIRHIGTARSEKDIERLKSLAQAIKLELEYQKNSENVSGNYANHIGKTKDITQKTNVDLRAIGEEARHVLGFHDVYNYIYDLLNFSNPFSQPSRRERSAKILNEVVIARIANPCSKRATVAMLEKDFGSCIKLDHVYQMMDKIDDAFYDRIQSRSLAATLKLTGEKLKILFYDATTLYFESFTEDDLKQNGYSKDMKFNQPQVLLALFVTRDGLPVGYELFPGAKKTIFHILLEQD